MHSKKSNAMVTTGIPTMFMIFAVLCLVILSLLSYATARTDMQTSERSFRQTRIYYEACNEATDWLREKEEKLSELHAMLQSGAGSEADSEISLTETSLTETSFTEKASQILLSGDLVPAQGEDSLQFILQVPFSERICLEVVVRLLFPENSTDRHLAVDEWYTKATGQWKPDNSQRLFMPASAQD